MKLSAAFLITSCLAVIFAEEVQSVISWSRQVEPHHSLHPPLDHSQVYWNYGGSTVLTKHFIRLTPSTQDMKGWLWNEYPIESDNWEVEVKYEVFSKPHFGGDGFGFWVLAGDHDPAFTRDPEALSGPIFGMKDEMTGFGVLFDTYDNDGRRNNPSVFVIKNDSKEKKLQFHHENDFDNDMHTTPPDNKTEANMIYDKYRCMVDFRNTGKVTSVVFKLQHKNLHVYIDVNDGQGFKFCLAVYMGQSFKDFHFAFSAATGQVADNHDILEINTRYLKESDKELNDGDMGSFGTALASTHTILQTLAVLVGLGLAAYTGFELSNFRALYKAQLNEMIISQTLNKYAVHQAAAHGVVSLLVLFLGWYLAFLCNLPLLVLRGYQLYTKTLQFSATFIIKRVGKGVGYHSYVSSASFRLTFQFAVLCAAALMYVITYFFL